MFVHRGLAEMAEMAEMAEGQSREWVRGRGRDDVVWPHRPSTVFHVLWVLWVLWVLRPADHKSSAIAEAIVFVSTRNPLCI